MTALILAAVDNLLPIRILAVLALLAVIGAFVYVVRHLKQIERTISSDNLVPVQRGPRNNLVLMMCAIPIIVISILLFLVLKA
jgi:heme/copper-type cytochrome/quinol oxidase subunit 2